MIPIRNTVATRYPAAVTYALIVLTVLHILVVYAFSSGPW